MRHRPTGLAVFVLALTTVLGSAPAAAADAWRAKIDPQVLAMAEATTADVIVYLAEQADLSWAPDVADRRTRGRAVYDALREAAERTQPGLRDALDAAGVPYRAFWVVNALAVPQADAALLAQLAARAEVARIALDPLTLLAPPETAFPFVAPAAGAGDLPWNLDQIGAPQVWANGNTGQHCVVGILDTGCDWEHPALRSQYRGWNGDVADHDYNWHDAAHTGGGVCGSDSPIPCDDNGHGTHILGAVVGDDGQGMAIGVAPGARWIACRCIASGWSSPSMLYEGFEWMLAPTPVGGGDSDPDRAPDVITTAWRCSSAMGCAWATLLPAVAAVRAAGIVVVATGGNDGPGCGGIVDTPACYDEAYTVGATGLGDVIAPFTSRGPVSSLQGTLVKPDLTAPGVNILSSLPNGDYAFWSGTAMAVAHVAGVVALAVTADPVLAGDPDAIENRLNATAASLMSDECGDGDAVPNNVYGHGRVDAEAACAPVTAVPLAAARLPRLLPNAPNPFNPRTTLAYELAATSSISLRIFDAAGRFVRMLVDESAQAPGFYSVTWDGRDQQGRDVAGGVYFSLLRSGGTSAVGRLVLVR
ncbi:MAG: S8 family serine peptidase [Candidatus Krumholzibacteria bacterium]|jgi:subtilisin family serine protease|nr:S8 family serine peptidase [Candidatus Krumholzibacteria bacterium]